MDFGIMFFSSPDEESPGNKYRLLIEAAKFADEHGFSCVWTPERHFHKFGGLFPNPSVTTAALAMVTSRLQLRAGSLVSPLHNAIRIAEEWSVADNLSNGRVAISFGSGWNVDDFIFFPERYSRRRELMYEQIRAIKSLWSGESVVAKNSFEKEIEVKIYPRPIQKELPVWVTSSGSPETYIGAGAIGANILTHLIGQDIDVLATNIEKYRDSLAANGFDANKGKVSLMLHTFLGADLEAVKSKVRTPFREYLRSAISLEEKAALSGGVISGGHKIDPHNIPAAVMEELLDITFERYFNTAALMGTVRSCEALVSKLAAAGVDEIACLIDFIDDYQVVIEGLGFLNELRANFREPDVAEAAAESLNSFMEPLESL